MCYVFVRDFEWSLIMSRREPLLFLTQRLPYPPDKGDKLRSFAVLRSLAEIRDIHLGCFIDDRDDWRHLETVKAYCADLCCIGLDKRWAKLRSLRGFAAGTSLSEPYFHDADLARWVGGVLRDVRPAAAFLYSSVMGQYLPLFAGSLSPGARPPRVVMDFVDVDSDKWSQYSKARPWPMSWVYARESRRLLAYDRAVAAGVDAGVFVSPAEADLFRRLAPEVADKVHAISNGIDLDYFTADPGVPNPFPPDSRPVVFTGAMDYWPNIDAATWFAEAMLPAVQAIIPKAVFYVVGANPTPAVIKLGERAGVTVTGRVPDIRPYLTHAEVAVAPLRVARGIQNKVLEGMAMGKIVVATSQGLEGLTAVPGCDLLVADAPQDFIGATIRALTDGTSVGGSLAPIGAAAQRRAAADYRWDDKLTAFRRLLEGSAEPAFAGP
jgi:polysaccharide biosynthesis protein PslH